MGNPFASVGLARHYSRFRVANRLLLTGHSHQAWPDVAFDAQQKAWLDAAAMVDEKWDRAAAVADEVRSGWRRLLNDPSGDIALGLNTHELVVRLLSAVLPMFTSARAAATWRTRVVTTDGEFHTIRRQVDRLAEEGILVVRVASQPAETLSERLAASWDLFPVLHDRRNQRAGALSGGERQSLAMARALMMEPKVLLLDEPSAGLSPVLQDEVFVQTRNINKAGVSVIMVEQNAKRCLQICDRGYVLDQGRSAYSGTGRSLSNDPKVIELYLGTLGKKAS